MCCLPVTSSVYLSSFNTKNQRHSARDLRHSARDLHQLGRGQLIRVHFFGHLFIRSTNELSYVLLLSKKGLDAPNNYNSLMEMKCGNIRGDIKKF